MALDLEQRYSRIGTYPDHVCTGNTAYRAAALRDVGLLDESLGYGYDNDLSYRLQAAGYRLRFCPDARSTHRWREGVAGYLAQQYGFGYGRLGLVARWPNRCTGDSVSPPAMMAHPIVMAAALCLLLAGALMQAMAGHTFALETAGLGLIGVLATERALAGVGAAMRFADPAALAFPLVHLARDLAWVGAALVWIARRALRRPHNPEHSMTARAAAG